MNYQVSESGEVIGTARSAMAAVTLLEKHWQCGVEDRAARTKELRDYGFTVAVHCIASELKAVIERV